MYKTHHGRLFKPGPGVQAEETKAEATAAAKPKGGPCCYLVFLEMVIYLHTVGPAFPEKDATETLVEDVPLAAHEMPACPLCLERLDVSGTGMVTHSHGWLSAMVVDKMADARCCRACAAVAHTLSPDAAEVLCAGCSKREELWVCMICGHIGCGRYAAGHAKDHATTRRHRFCFELASGRIWDYHGDVFVHRRLVQMTAAGEGTVFELTLPAPASATSNSLDSVMIGDTKPLKPGQENTFAMELDVILASQLDYQRSLYESRLAEFAVRHSSMMAKEEMLLEEEVASEAQLRKDIAEAERRKKSQEKQSLAAKRSLAKAEEQLAFIKDLNRSMIANRKQMAAAAKQAEATESPPGGQARAPKVKDDDAMVKRLRQRVAELMERVSASDSASSTSAVEPVAGTTAAGESSGARGRHTGRR